MMRVTLAGACALLSLSTASSVAHAFSDPERFTAPAEEGGADGRFFTGSPSDGHSCVVCHSKGSAPDVVVRGLPTAGYKPDESYQVELRFRNQDGNHALALELVDASGRDLGLELFSDQQIDASEHCGGEANERRASYLTKQGERRIVGVEACEAQAVRFRFRAPRKGPVFFVASVLSSDNSATVEGDGVTEIAQELYRQGEAPVGDKGACSVRPLRREFGGAWPLLALAGLLIVRRRRARDRASDRTRACAAFNANRRRASP